MVVLAKEILILELLILFLFPLVGKHWLWVVDGEVLIGVLFIIA